MKPRRATGSTIPAYSACQRGGPRGRSTIPDGTVTRSFVIIITTPADAEIVELHSRMLVILEPADWAGAGRLDSRRPGSSFLRRLPIRPSARAAARRQYDAAKIDKAVTTHDPRPSYPSRSRSRVVRGAVAQPDQSVLDGHSFEAI